MTRETPDHLVESQTMLEGSVTSRKNDQPLNLSMYIESDVAINEVTKHNQQSEFPDLSQTDQTETNTAGPSDTKNRARSRRYEFLEKMIKSAESQSDSFQ